jgi:membrane-bound lytic murein transglycosylase D
MRLERKCRVGILILAFWLMLGFYVGGGQQPVTSAPPAPSNFVPCFKLPGEADFCGERAPLSSSDVSERYDREFTLVTQSHAQVYLWLKRKERYFPWVEALLARMGLPADLKYVAVAESDLTPHAVSRVGASGPWQFMTQTACRFGMRCNSAVDDRYDFEKSATAAFQYLKHLHDIFHSWTLAAAAYNCGENRLAAAMKLDKSNSYYDLVLPLETERYVFRILAIKEVMENPEKYGYYLPKGSGYPPLLFDSVQVSLPGPMPIIAAAQSAGVTYREIKMLNTGLISDVIPAGDITVRVPQGRAKQFEKGVAAWKSAYKPAEVVHQVVRGETLDSIARHYNATRAQLCQWNHIVGNKVRIGQKLKIRR